MAARKASTVRPAPRHLLDIFSPRNQLNEPVTAPENRDSPAVDRSFPSSAVPFTFEELVAFCGILLIFWVVGKSVEKFGLPALVGEILAGIAVGPHGMNIAPKPDALMMVGEFGLVLMVLEAGVEVDLASLSLVGARGVKVAFFGSLVPLAIGATLAKLVFDMSAKTCLAVGACLAPTSMGISLKVLQDGGVLGTPTGQLIIAAAVMDDVIALVLLSQLEALKDPTVVNFLVPIASSLAFIVLVGYLATRVVPDVLVKQVVPRVPKRHLEGVLLGAVFVAAYGMMVATHYGKSSHLLGAFLGGLCFCSLSSMQHVWHAQVEKILSWLIRVFFACTIGFEVPIRDLWTAPVLARAAVFMLAAFGKVATGLFARPFNAHEAAKIGFAMSAWGEFAFIVATASREAGTLGKQEFSAVILCVLLSAMYAPLAVNSAIKAEKRAAGLGKDGKRSLALVESGRSRWLCCGPKVLKRHVSFTTLAMPDGKQTAVYRVYYVCAIECPSRWGLNDAVLRAVYHPSVNLDVLDVSLEPRGNDAMACELFLRDPILRAPLDAELDCEENRRVTAKLVALKHALEKLVLASASGGEKDKGAATAGDGSSVSDGEVLIARWVPDIEPPMENPDANDDGDGSFDGEHDESFVLKQAQDLLRIGETEEEAFTDLEAGGVFPGEDEKNANANAALSVSDPDSRPSTPGLPTPRASVTLRRRQGRRAIDALRAHKNRPFYRTASLANLIHNGDDLQDERDQVLHARLVEARLASGEARALADARSGGHGMGAVHRTVNVQRARAAQEEARRLSAGERSLLDRISEDPEKNRGRKSAASRRESLDGEDSDSYVLTQLGVGGSPQGSAPTSAHSTMTAATARSLAAELKMQDVMLSSQTLSGAAGRALANELRHALLPPGSRPPESPNSRRSISRTRRLSAGAVDGENAAAVTSLTGDHARELAHELAERLAEAEAMAPAERAAAFQKKSGPERK